MPEMVAINPATEEELSRFSYQGEPEVQHALDVARSAFTEWRNTTFRERAAVLAKAATEIDRRVDELALLATREMGKPIGESRYEVEKCANAARWFGANGEELLASYEVHDLPGTTVTGASARMSYLPLGVLLGIFPWNFPYWQWMRAAAPALMAGNVMVFKHASNVPGCAEAIADVFAASGAPRGLMQNLRIPGPRAEALIGDPRIAAVTFTGSTDVGARVGAAAGIAIKKSVLELGGSDPFIVLADADIPAAADAAAKMRLRNSGQACICSKRLIVEASVYSAFIEALVASTKALTVGNPEDPTMAIGPLARADLRDTLEDQLRRSKAAGARVILGGERPYARGWFMAPTIIESQDTELPAFREETFGPLALVIRVRDADEAIALANRTEYGLAGIIWTGDLARGRALAARMQTGTVSVNGSVNSAFNVPFGGVGRSGYGRELGREGIREFTNVQSVVSPDR